MTDPFQKQAEQFIYTFWKVMTAIAITIAAIVGVWLALYGS